MLKTKPEGPIPARIMLAGEGPGEQEEGRTPFRGSAGKLLDGILHDAGIARTDCFITNCTPFRPDDNKIENFFHDGWTKSRQRGTMRLPKEELLLGLQELEQQIREVRPNVIVAFGNTPFWALCGRPSAKSGVGDWRGSELMLAERIATRPDPVGHSCVVIPTYHPAAVLRNWEWRALVLHDLRSRALKYQNRGAVELPPYRFTIRPTYEQVQDIISTLRSKARQGPIRISVDLETGSRLIWCTGLAWSRHDALCIPFRSIESPAGYFRVEEEVAIVLSLQELLEHPNCRVVGQNFLYDAQYFARYLGFVPRVRDDTMLQQHVAYAGMEKGLDFLSSLYCDFHRFWKSEGKDVGKPKNAQVQEEGWVYNCKDAVITFEVAEVLDKQIDRLGLRPQYQFQMELWHHALQMMLRGVKISLPTRKELTGELLEEIQQRHGEIQQIAGHPLNINSNPQMKALLYDDLHLPVQYKRTKGVQTVTCDKKALAALARIEPLIKGFLQRIAEVRSMENSLGVINQELGPDLRGRSYFNVAGAETFRWSSSEDAFGSGTNYQNLSSGHEEDDIEEEELVQYNLPNVRRLFIPDSGYTIAELDQAGADAWVFAFEAQDERMIEILSSGKKFAAESAKIMFGAAAGPDGRREPHYTRAKSGGHATNYAGTPYALTKALNISDYDARRFQRTWFEMYPGVKRNHERIQGIINASKQVKNRFGYRRFYFDRPENLLKDALAWIPQSTVAVCTNIGITLMDTQKILEHDYWPRQYLDPDIDDIRRELKRLGVQVLIQVHDSIVFQYPTVNEYLVLRCLRRAFRIRVPYDPPLYIPWGLKTSTKSWGDAEERKKWLDEPELIVPQRGLVLAG